MIAALLKGMRRLFVRRPRLTGPAQSAREVYDGDAAASEGRKVTGAEEVPPPGPDRLVERGWPSRAVKDQLKVKP